MKPAVPIASCQECHQRVSARGRGRDGHLGRRHMRADPPPEAQSLEDTEAEDVYGQEIKDIHGCLEKSDDKAQIT